MASKEVADLTHAEDWVGVELHIVRGIVRDGAGNVTNHGQSRRVTLEELAAVIATIGTTVFASTAEAKAGAVNNKAISPATLHAAAAPQVLAIAAGHVAWNMALGANAKVTLDGNHTIDAPTNFELGVSYVLEIIQDGAGNRVPNFNACYDWGSAGAPTLSTAAGKRDLVVLYCYDATVGAPKFRASFNKSA